MSTAIDTAKTSSSPKGILRTRPLRNCIVHRLSSALGTKYIAISDLRDAGSNRMANAQTKLDIITFHRSIFWRVFLVKHIIKRKVETKTAKNRLDLMMFLTRLLRILTGLSKVRSGVCLLGKEGLAFEEQNWDQMDRDVELVGRVENRLKLDPCVVVATVVVNVLAVQEAALVDVI